MGNAFGFEELEGPIGLVTFDVADSKVNTFSQPVLAELTALVGEWEQRTDLKGLLIQSGKPGQFIAGADLRELGALAYATPEQVKVGLAAGHSLFDRVSRLPFPTVALIDGNCMGGGTELILSMDYRIGSDNPKTQIALPEVKIGLIPGWGGTQRMPRLVGISSAIDLICSGKSIPAQQAAAIGLVFDAVPAERLVEEGCRLIRYTRESGEWEANRKRLSGPLGLSADQAQFTFAVAEAQVKAETKGQYPAPLAALRAIKKGVNLTLEEGLEVEKETALEVVGSQISANLIGVFFMNNKLSRDPGIDNTAVKPRPVHRVGVLGAGQMGAGIATAHARSRIPSGMVDVDDDALARGLQSATKVVADRIKIGRATHENMQEMLAMLSTSTSPQLFSDCDVVIEAVTENEKLKTKIYGEISGRLRDDAILASNTSTISITRMAEFAPEAERFVGMHFFYPVDRMQLVEVIRGEKTSDETIATIVQLAKRIRKIPIVVNDCAGFLVNRILLPYMNESLMLLQEGASIDAIDAAATRFGMPMGPIALHDFVGLDTACYAGKVMVAAYQDRAVECPLLEDLVNAGRLGQKSGAGFRVYRGKRSRPVADPEFQKFLEPYQTESRDVSKDEIGQRLFLSMLLEAVRCLEDQIVREPAHVDMGLILGIGFPPFRGGILRWCDSEGAANILGQLDPYRPLGKRFEAPELLEQMAKSGDKFYPPPKVATSFGGPS
jgi:3-hydroxyacyl-CoA dehydrogenase/enoyl-CoA hydratase/3-hydroxybutyryl-CoA epimerase/3-hydroxyacyl-CoA dehydrogenase/enoyl-CoA hydratase/3-hydroxybutyryl-CoA epimerase/enoyl-CoA isomerase